MNIEQITNNYEQKRTFELKTFVFANMGIPSTPQHNRSIGGAGCCCSHDCTGQWWWLGLAKVVVVVRLRRWGAGHLGCLCGLCVKSGKKSHVRASGRRALANNRFAKLNLRNPWHFRAGIRLQRSWEVCLEHASRNQSGESSMLTQKNEPRNAASGARPHQILKSEHGSLEIWLVRALLLFFPTLQRLGPRSIEPTALLSSSASLRLSCFPFFPSAVE